MKTYIGDRNEIIVGRANGLAPDGSAVMVIARTSTTYGNGVLVMRAQDGLNWTSEFLPTTEPMAGCAYDASSNTIYVINAISTNNEIVIRKSTNYGSTWTTDTSSIGNSGGTPWTSFSSVWFDSARSRLVISTGSRINLQVGTITALQSKDGGATWTALHTNQITNGTFAGVAFAPNAPYPLFMRASASSGTGISIYKSNLNDDTLEEMNDVIDTIYPVSAGYTIAYSPLYKTYVAPNGLTSGSSPTSISFSLEPDGPARNATVLSGDLNSLIGYICWSDEDKQFFGSCLANSASTDPALYRTFKSVYGSGGWVYDPAPIYNIQNRFGVSMFYDSIRKLTQIYSHGYTAAQRIQLGYLGIAGSLPTPTPTPTSSITPTPSSINQGGLVWVNRTPATSINWKAVSWSTKSEIFAAVADSGSNRVMTSPDGIVWTNATGGLSSVAWADITYSPELDRFVAVGNGNITYSTGTGSWTILNNATITGGNWISVEWSPELSMFVAVSISGTAAMTSPDGITWTARTASKESLLVLSLAWSPSLKLFVATGTNNGDRNAMTSPDGITWTIRTTTSISTADSWSKITWSEALGKFVAIGGTTVSNVIATLTSEDGINWTINTSPWAYGSAQSWTALSWSPELSLFVILARSGTRRTATSADGVNWSTWPDPVADIKANTDVVWSQRRFMFVAVGDSSVITGQSQIVPVPTPTPTVTPSNTPSPSVIYDGLFYHESNITNYGD